MKPLSFCNYRYPRTVTTLELAAAYNAHARNVGQPAVIRVNPSLVDLTKTWLKSIAAPAEVRPNGGTLANEVWIAAVLP